MNTIARKDLYRWYGPAGEDWRHRLFRPPELKFVLALRRAQAGKSLLAHWRLHRLSRKTGIQIRPRTRIGEGFYIGHTGRVIINPDAVIGCNVNVATGVTIGAENRGRRKGSPIIGDNVWIGTNAVVVGRITVGCDVMIAPLAFVNFDVPDHSLVVGNPGRIIPKTFATEGYVDNTV